MEECAFISTLLLLLGIFETSKWGCSGFHCTCTLICLGLWQWCSIFGYALVPFNLLYAQRMQLVLCQFSSWLLSVNLMYRDFDIQSSEFHVDRQFHSLFLWILPSMGTVLHFVMCWVFFLQWKVVSPSPTLLPGGLCPLRCLWLVIQMPHHVWRPCSPPLIWGYVICLGDWCTDMNTHKLYQNGLNTVSNVC
jgi:hypothetical protein